MKYTFEYTVQYQDVDATRRIRLFTLENYLLNVAGRISDQLGFGIQYLYPQGLTWIITRLQLQMDYLPIYRDKLTIETWIEQNAHMLSVRDYRIFINNSYVGCAKSQWAVLDLQKRTIVSIFDQPVFAGCVDGDILSMPIFQRIHPIDQPTGRYPYQVKYADIDYNGHLNSCRYLEHMLNAYMRPLDTPFRLIIQYVKEVGLDDQVDIQYLTSNNSVQYQIVGPDQTISSMALLTSIPKIEE